MEAVVLLVCCLLSVMVVCIIVMFFVFLMPQSTQSPYQTTPFVKLSLGANVRGTPPPIVTKEGKRAYEFVMFKGKVHPSGTNASFSISPASFFPSDRCRVRFKVWFDENFTWDETDQHPVAGKVAGFVLGDGGNGGEFSTKGGSYRLTFREKRGAVAYLYPQVRQAYTGRTISWSLLDQKDSVIRQSYVSTGVHVFVKNRQPIMRFKAGQWNVVEMHAKLNTPGKYDGIMELAINDDRQTLDEVRYRLDNEVKIENFLVQPFFGGSNTSYAPKTDIRMWFTDFEMATT